MRTYDSAQKAAKILDRQFWTYFDRVDRCWLPKVKSNLNGSAALVSRGCSMTVPEGSKLTPDQLVAGFVLDHGTCMAATIKAVADDPLARDPRCQCLALDRRRRVA